MFPYGSRLMLRHQVLKLIQKPKDMGGTKLRPRGHAPTPFSLSLYLFIFKYSIYKYTKFKNLNLKNLDLISLKLKVDPKDSLAILKLIS